MASRAKNRKTNLKTTSPEQLAQIKKKSCKIFDVFFPQVPNIAIKTDLFIIPPANFVCGGYTVFTLSVRASVHACVHACVRPSVTLCFLNIFKSHCWIFIKPCKHVHICKTNTLNKKVRARGQFY